MNHTLDTARSTVSNLTADLAHYNAVLDDAEATLTEQRRSRAAPAELAQATLERDATREACDRIGVDLATARDEMSKLEQKDARSKQLDLLKAHAEDATRERELLAQAASEGGLMLQGVAQKLLTHLLTLRASRQSFAHAADTLSSGFSRSTFSDHDTEQSGRSLLIELKRSGVNLDAVLDSSSGNFSHHDTHGKPLPGKEHGQAVWWLLYEVLRLSMSKAERSALFNGLGGLPVKPEL